MYVQRRKYLKGMLIFIVADIWNCYNMDNKTWIIHGVAVKVAESHIVTIF